MSSTLQPKSKLWLINIMRWQVYRITRLVVEVGRFKHRGGATDELQFFYQKQRNQLNWAKQLTRLPCLVVYVKFQLVFITKSLNAQDERLPSSP